MATVKEIQDAIDATASGAQITAGPLFTASATIDTYACRGGAATGGRVNRRLVNTTRADSAATQAAAINAALIARR